MPTSLSSVFFEVPDAMLPSATFCLLLRAACTTERTAAETTEILR